MRIITTVLLVLLTTAVLFGCGSSQPAATAIPPTPTPAPEQPTATTEPDPDTIIMTTGEFAPFTSETLEGYGFVTEIVTAVFNEMGKTPVYEFYPWKRTELAVTNGNAWAAFPYSYNEERAETFAFSDVVAYSTTVFFYYKPNMPEAVEWQELEDLQPYTIGGVLGYFYEPMLEEAQLTTDYASSEDLAMKKLQLGRIDLLPLEEQVGWSHIRNLFPDEVDNFAALERPLSKDPMHMMIQKDNPESVALMEEFNTALQTIRDKGIYQEIRDKYYE